MRLSLLNNNRNNNKIYYFQRDIFYNKIFKSFIMSKSIEENVGIVLFTNNYEGFSGILKQRYSDFIVREISLNNEIASLKNLNGSILEQKYFPSNDLNISTDIDTIINDFLVKLKELVQFNEEREQEISQVLQSSYDRSDDCPSEFTLVECPTKETRTAVHQLIKKYFQLYLDSDTLTIDGIQWVRLLPKHKAKKGAKKWRTQWPSTVPEYLQFILFKENIDTMSAINQLTKMLRIKQDSLRFCGTKDKRAVTAQWITGYRLKPSQLYRFNKLKFPLIRVGDFSYVREPLTLGQLKGNRFEIILRDIQSNSSIVETACEGLKSSGYMNYFGLQRFGRGGSISGSHLIGLKLFQSNWKAATDLMFVKLPNDRSEVLEAKIAYQNGDYELALQLLPRSMYAEIQVLEKLKNDPRDFYGAYHRIPRSTQLICIHAFQSYIFNLAATHRIQQYGHNVVIGDLVALSPDIIDSNLSIDDEGINNDNDNSNLILLDETQQNTTTTVIESTIHIVTQDDIDNNRFSIHDVILPLVCKNIKYPQNLTGQYIQSLLLEKNISFNTNVNGSSELKDRLKQTYRRIVEYPTNLEYNIIRYSEQNETLQKTEFDDPELDLKLELKQQSRNSRSQGNDESNNNNNDNNNNNNDIDENITNKSEEIVQIQEESKELNRLALRIVFDLSPGSYATMLLRELMKTSTEASYHAELTANLTNDELKDKTSSNSGINKRNFDNIVNELDKHITNNNNNNNNNDNNNDNDSNGSGDINKKRTRLDENKDN